MAGAGTTTGTSQGTEAGAGAAGGATGAAGASTPATPITPAVAPAAVAASAHPQAPRELGDGEEPQPGERISLSAAAFAARMARNAKATLREVAGTDDPKTIKERLALADQLEREAKERTQAAMTELDREKAKVAEAEARAQAAEVRAQAVEEQAQVNETTRVLNAIAGEHIKEKYFKMALLELSEHLSDTYTEAQIEAMTDKQRDQIVRTFFTDYAKNNPELAKAVATGGGGGGAGEVGGAAGGANTPTVPLQNGVGTPKGRGQHAKPAPVSFTTGPWQGKTLAPGHPNSMSKAELEAWKRSTGNNY